jgi:hypothetical protein
MHLDELARRADEARAASEVARTKLERTARRWAERQRASALDELRRTAEEFDRAQRMLEESLRDWARYYLRQTSSIGAAAASRAPSVPSPSASSIVRSRL